MIGKDKMGSITDMGGMPEQFPTHAHEPEF